MTPGRRGRPGAAGAGLALAAALAMPAAVPAGEHWHTLTHASAQRNYRVDVADGAATRGAPVLIARGFTRWWTAATPGRSGSASPAC